MVIFLQLIEQTIIFSFVKYDRSNVKDRQGENNPSKRAKAIIAKLDSSGDRKLNREEFIKGYIVLEMTDLSFI